MNSAEHNAGTERQFIVKSWERYGAPLLKADDQVVLRAIKPDELPLEELILVLSSGGQFQFDLTLRFQVAGRPQDLEATRLSGTGSVISTPVQYQIDGNEKRVSSSISEVLLVNTKSPLDGSEVARFGDVEVDFRKMELLRCGRKVEVTAHEFKTLRYLVTRPDVAISRDEMLNQVWGYQHYQTTRTVDNRIMKLRQKLERVPSKPVHLLTVRGFGYKFVP